MPDNTDKKKLYSEIIQLNQSISTLALKVSSKEKELTKEKCLYDEKIRKLDVYLEQIRKLLGINTSNDEVVHIEDVLDAQEKVSREYPNMIVIPKSSFKKTKHDGLNSTTIQEKTDNNNPKSNYIGSKVGYNSALHTSQRKRKGYKSKKITCSYCKKVGHKRAECPKIYLGESFGL